MTLEDAFRILKIKPTDNKKIILNQYRKLTLQFHPDRNKDLDAQKTYELIKKAYEVISLYHLTATKGIQIKKVNEITKADIQYKTKLKEQLNYRKSKKEKKKINVKQKWNSSFWYLFLIIVILFLIIIAI
jgi:ribosomal protein L20A (L18A)